ncbi:MAG TPA: Crp/Fnr family transcriptional regulator [Sphingomicrobium sp.]|jgi:hypothetical protein|nr:Crp/Fnr family transcriptional regulator [Sphingomicrobium sp.]
MVGRVDENVAVVSGNNLLRALRPADAAILNPYLEPWIGARGQVIYEPGDPVRTVYFPCGPSLISYLVVLRNGMAVETALIGREGAVGGIVSKGRLPAFARAEVQFPGPFMRMQVADLEALKEQSPTLGNLFARYADCLTAQIFQGGACNAAHSIEQRTAKWLVSAVDRTGGPDIPLTQDQLAAMLAVGRSYISRVLRELKQRGILETRRGSLYIRDIVGLRGLACECNDSVRDHFEEVLSGVYPTDDELIAA